jgi:peptidoglycan hydrolase-like protein with peptidoglycan-binding domain
MLHLGSRGPEVLRLQKALQAAGFSPHGLDGRFGPETQAAVLAFQRARGLVVDGKAGPQTFGSLSSGARGTPGASANPAGGMLNRGSRGPQVLSLQRALASAGFNPHGFDGWFGPRTQAAVLDFQRARGLSADGNVGPQTWAELGQRGTGPVPVTSGAGGPALRGASGARAAGPTGADARPPTSGIQSMLTWAKSMIGSPYAAVNPFRFGEVPWDGKAHRRVNGSSTVWNYPKGTRVFDCSGFVVAAYRQLGVDLAAHGLASSGAMAADTKFLQTISKDALQPGDLITYSPHDGVGHVVIYLGNGQCIQAGGSHGVGIVNVDWSRANHFKRVPL